MYTYRTTPTLILVSKLLHIGIKLNPVVKQATIDRRGSTAAGRGGMSPRRHRKLRNLIGTGDGG